MREENAGSELDPEEKSADPENNFSFRMNEVGRWNVQEVRNVKLQILRLTMGLQDGVSGPILAKWKISILLTTFYWKLYITAFKN